MNAGTQIMIGNIQYTVLGQSVINPESNHARYVSGYVYLKTTDNGRIIFRVLIDRNGKLGNRIQSTGCLVSKTEISELIHMDANVGRR